MNRFKSLVIALFIFALMFPLFGGESAAPPDGTVVIAMCRPLVSQIRNIETMYEKDIITLDRLRLICVYHEDEGTDYEPSREYVKKNKLTWVSFEVIKGKVAVADLFKPNTWTAQFLSVFNRAHGIIFTGGADIPPAVYGEENHLLTEAVTPNRTLYEVSFLFHLLGGSRNPSFKAFLEERPDYPVLGICLGCQTMNVATGGTLYQDIPRQVYGLETVEQVLKAGFQRVHSSRYVGALNPLEKGLPPAFHTIRFKKGGVFVKRLKMKPGDTPYVLTSHHQALKKIGTGLKVIATSMDGKIVEMVEHGKYKNVLGVQFHPEYYTLYMKGRYFRKDPGAPLTFNLREFLISNPPTMPFHKAIWSWYSDAVKK